MGSENEDHRIDVEQAIKDAKIEFASWADAAKAKISELELFNKMEHKSPVRSTDSQTALKKLKLEFACFKGAQTARGKQEKCLVVANGKTVLMLDKYFSASDKFDEYDGIVRIGILPDLPKKFVAELSWILVAQEERAQSNVSNYKTAVKATAANWLRKSNHAQEIDTRSAVQICMDMRRGTHAGIRVYAEVPAIPKAALRVALEIAKEIPHSKFHIVFSPNWVVEQWSAAPVDRLWKVVCAIVPTFVFSVFIQLMMEPITKCTSFLQYFVGLTWSAWYPLIAPAFILGTFLCGLMGLGVLAGWVGFAMIVFDCTKEYARRAVMACLTQAVFKSRKVQLFMTVGDAQYKLAQW